MACRTLPREDPDERLQLLRLLLVDRDWSCTPPVRRRLQGLLARPPVCREASWLLLAEEIAAYLAFRKQGEVEARACGCTRSALRFTRSEWEAACGETASSSLTLDLIADSSTSALAAP